MVSQVSAILYFALSLFYLANGSPIVKTNNGHLFGSSENEANVFYSVPYAQPPVGNLRFQDPVAIGYHGDIHVTNDTGVSCISMSFTCTDEKKCPKFESEDCLYLNVYVPKNVDLSDPTNPPKADIPVLVWIHGGAFAFGSGLMPIYDGRFVSQKSGAIVVSINYRYMPFGFLAMSTGSSSAPGNMGIHDQQLALEWVQENIAAFGGNKQQVTIFGESAGAQSVALHLMSTTSKPLFSNAIMQSNPSTFLFKTAAEAQELGTRLAKRAGCLTGSYTCLAQKSSDEIKKAFVAVTAGNLLDGDLYGAVEAFSPTIDGVEFTQQQLDAFAGGNWNTDKNIMIGTDSQEGYSVSRVIPVPISYNRLVSLFERMWHDMSTSVVQLYAPDPSLSDYRDALGNMLTHFGFTCPSRYLARAAVATKGISKKVYSFINYHPLSGPGCPAIVGSLEVLCGYAFHASELSYVWRTGPIIGQTYTEDEIPYVNSWTNYIGNFVHSGNVNKGMDAGLQSELGSFAEWPTYDAPIAGSSTGSDDWLSAALDAPYPSIEQEPLDQYCSFWDNIGYDYKIFGQVLADALNMVVEDE